MKCNNCGKEISRSDEFCPYCGMQQTQIYNDGYGIPGGDGSGYDDNDYMYGEPPQQKGGRKAGIIILAVVLALIIAGILAYVLVFSQRTPEMEDLTYDDLISGYDLSDNTSDDIEKAYHDSIRIEFEDVSKDGRSKYKATAVIYTPDMEDIYEKTTDSGQVADRLGRVSDDDLDQTRKSVKVTKNGKMTQSSAHALYSAIKDKYMTIDEYKAENDSDDSDSGRSAASESGNSDTGTGSASQDRTGKADAPDSGSSSGGTVSGYLLPGSSSGYISSSSLSGFSAYQCRIARNEIYARHGRMFKDSSLQNYFDSCSWYTPSIPADSFSDSMLNQYERANIQTIKSYEHAHGYNGQ